MERAIVQNSPLSVVNWQILVLRMKTEILYATEAGHLSLEVDLL